MQIEKVDGDKYLVHSNSGNVYIVRFCGMDGELLKWGCDCPAGAHGKRCKHQVAVARMNADEAEDNGMDVGMGDIFGCR